MKRTKERPRCEHRLCIVTATVGKFCYFHAKVAAGLIEPAITGNYSKAVLEQARHREMSRLKADLNA